VSEFFVQREGGGLKPYTVEDAEKISRLAFGKPILVKATVQRNGRFAALYWVLCQRIGNALGLDVEVVSDMLKIETGHAHTLKSKKYGTLHLPRSISFAKMDESSFREFFDKAVSVICSEWRIERADVLACVEDILVPTERRK
jgi:hypothetical protein